MADDVEQGSAELSTDETEPIEVPFEERVSQQLDVLVKDIRDTNARMSGIQSIYDRNTAEIGALKQAFTEEYGTSKKALSLFEQFIRTSQGEEAWKQYEEQQELQSLREQQKVTPKTEPPPPAPDPLWTKREDAFYGPLLAEVHEHAIQRGFSFDLAGLGSVFGAKFKKLEWGVPTDTDPLGTRSLAKAMKEIVDQEAARLRNRVKPRVTPAEVTRGTSGVEDADAEYLRALREGKPLPSAEEIDRITAKYVQMR